MCSQLRHLEPKPSALIIEDDPLILWSLRSYFGSRFVMWEVSTLDAALLHLRHSHPKFIICGSPIVDCEPAALEEFAADPKRVVIALGPDSSVKLPRTVMVVRKPFTLEEVSKLLEGDSSNVRSESHDD